MSPLSLEPGLEPPASWTTAMRASVAAAATRRPATIGRRSRPAPGTLAARGQLAVHQGRMNRAFELVGSGRERRNVVDRDLRAREVLPVEHLLARRVEDVDVVRRPGVLVVEREGERLVSRG